MFDSIVSMRTGKVRTGKAFGLNPGTLIFRSLFAVVQHNSTLPCAFSSALMALFNMIAHFKFATHQLGLTLSASATFTRMGQI